MLFEEIRQTQVGRSCKVDSFFKYIYRYDAERIRKVPQRVIRISYNLESDNFSEIEHCIAQDDYAERDCPFCAVYVSLYVCIGRDLGVHLLNFLRSFQERIVNIDKIRVKR